MFIVFVIGPCKKKFTILDLVIYSFSHFLVSDEFDKAEVLICGNWLY